MWKTQTNVGPFDRSSRTLCTVGGGRCGRCIAWQRPVGGTTVTTDAAKSSVKTEQNWAMTSRVKSYLYCIPISTQQFSNVVTSRLVVIISTFYELSYTLEFLNKTPYRPMIYLLLFYVLFSFTDLRIFVVLIYTITLKLFCNILFLYFLTLIHRFKTWIFVHSHCSKWYNILLASLSTNQEPIRSNPPRLSPLHCA